MKESELSKKIKRLKLLAFDVDGVLTDGNIYIDGINPEIKQFNTKDGYGIEVALKRGIQVALISGRESKAVSFRAKELGIEFVFQGIKNKKVVLNSLKKKLRFKKEEVSFMGDDIPDLKLKSEVGVFISPSDAIQLVKDNSDYVVSKCGGKGAVREWIDIVLLFKGII
jgi:3-deoxy-D-manno-octulosonate 8-phosphate phosphatase (KDO 8-P phosphatase)